MALGWQAPAEIIVDFGEFSHFFAEVRTISCTNVVCEHRSLRSRRQHKARGEARNPGNGSLRTIKPAERVTADANHNIDFAAARSAGFDSWAIGPEADAPGFMLTPASRARYFRTMTLTLPTLLLLSYARNEIVCSPGPTIGKSNENRSRGLSAIPSSGNTSRQMPPSMLTSARLIRPVASSTSKLACTRS